VNTVEILIAKWDAATRELSMVEDGAYWRLVRWCYANESLVPLDTMSQYRVAGAYSDAEKDAVRLIINRFFERTPEGYRQAKVSELIRRWKAGEPEREATAQVAKERKAASRARGKEMRDALRLVGEKVSMNMSNEMLLALCEVHNVPIQRHWRAPSNMERLSGVRCDDLRENEGMSLESQEASQGDTPCDIRGGVSVTESQACDIGVATESQESQESQSHRVTESQGSVTGVTGSAAGLPARAPDTNTNTNTNTKNTLTLFEGEPRAHTYAGGAAGALTREGGNDTPTRRGMAGMALKRGGLGEFNLAHPALLALLEAGVDDEELQMTAAEATARGKGFAYVLAMIKGRRDDAAAAGAIPGRTPSLIEQLAPSIAAHRSPDKRSG
jgi:uncharacterized protein YdaU (DUF1376 family)